MNEPNVNPIQQPSENVSALHIHKEKPQKTAQDWVRDMRMSAAVNKATTGVETDQVTPDLLLATSKRLLGISKREQEPDPKDSLAFQRFYGPEMLFSEHILRDNGKLGRNILWKATNRGNLNFMPVGALEKHISSVFYDSKLAQMMDGSSPLETIDSAYKTTRLGEGGIGSLESAPDEMRTVQPSYFGYIDPIRCFAKGTEIKTEGGWKAIENVTTEDKTLVKTEDGHKYLPIKKTYRFSYNDVMIGYDDGVVAFQVTPHHRLYMKEGDAWVVDFAENLYGQALVVNLSETEEQLHTLDESKWYRTKCDGYVYCVTVENELLLTRFGSPNGLVILNSPESIRVGLDVYMTKNVMKGTDGKLYQKFIDAKTGKEVLLDSETAANSVIAAPEMMEAKTKSVYALGGPTGIHIVPRSSVQYYLPRADEAYSAASNLIPMLSGVKNMRVQMGCLHPDTNVIVIDKHGLITTKQAKVLDKGSLPGATKEGTSQVYPIRTTVSKFPPKKNWFRKVILRSGRSIITSADHRWSILRKGEYMLVEAKDLKQGDIALRTTFKDVPSRRTFINHMLVNKQLAKALGILARSLDEPDNKKMRVTMQEEDYPAFMEAMARIGYTEGFNTYLVDHAFYVGIRDDGLRDLLRNLFGRDDRTRHVPTEIMSAGAAVVGTFIDGYTSDLTKMGQDSNDDIWVLDIPNLRMRDELAFLFARLETDTLYRDRVAGKAMDLALKLVPMEPDYGDMITDEIKLVQSGINAPIMIDIDVDDNLYATANGVVTHNSKYPLQAVSIASREAPMVRGLDEITGKDMPTLIGKYLGARFADRDGVVTAVRKDRIDVQYSDGSKGKVDLYVNFPMNAKGYINNTPVVKAGQAFKKGDVLASSNYTDDKGVAAIGTNLRTGWLSWKGGTYEDAVVISESAAKKLTSTTMYKTSVDLDKTITLGKKNYITWKPAEFTKEQMENLDDNGVVKPGTLLHKEDPMILAVRTTEPSPGTMGKRILTDLSERWEHDYPGVVTDVVKTRNGIKVYATVTAPAEVGDKLSGSYGNKGVISQIVPDDEMPQNAKGEPLEMLFSPLGLITRCYDENTEFLTKRGWVYGRDITDADEFYCFDTEDNTWRWGKQLEPFHTSHYEGKMYGYSGKMVDFCVTPHHKVWAAGRHGDFKRCTIEDIYGREVRIPCVARREDQPEAKKFELPLCDGARGNVPDTYDANLWAEFLGWYLAEGFTIYNEGEGRYCVCISQFRSDKNDNVKLIETLLDRLGLKWTYVESNKVFRIYSKRLAAYFMQFGYCDQKHAPDWLFEQPDDVLYSFLDGVMLGDGYLSYKKGTDGRRNYVCNLKVTSEKLIDQVQMICCMLGIATAKTFVGVDPRFPESRPQWYIGMSITDKTTRHLDDGWYMKDYNGMVYCPTVETGYILTRRNGKTAILSNTNPAQLYEAQLGKIAKKTGKPITVPAFFKGSMQEYVADQLKQNHLKPDEDLINPETGLPIKDVLTGYSYIYKLKHLSESKMSARGTSTYDAEGNPAGKGMDGCFPASQILLTRNGQKRMGEVAGECGIAWIETMADDKKRRFGRVIDRFKRYVPAEDLLSITSTWSYKDDGKYSTRTAEMRPTKNHAIYMYDMTQKHAVDLKPGDKLAGIGLRPTDEQLQILWNLMHKPGVIDNDKLHVFYDPEANKLARFKADALKALGVKRIPKLHEIVVPKYSLYEATLTDADNGDLSKALQALDDAEKDYPISSEDQLRISDWIPWKVIPDYTKAVRRLAKKQQRLAAVRPIGLEPYPGLMPLIVAGVAPLKRKAALQVFDLTVENIHRYVLKGGFLVSNSKRFGTLEQSAMAGHGAFDIIKDSKYIRGQSNSDFWRSLRTGDIPTMPGEPLVHKKFFAHLTGAGINVKKTPKGVSIFALTNKDVSELAGPRELRNRDTYEARTFRPIDGGLFGQDIFGINGDKWAYIQLDEPVPNPVMEGPLSLLLNIPEKKFADVAAGKDSVNGISGGPAMKKALEKMDLQAESARALDAYKTSSMSNKDKALKRYVAIERMRRQGVNPAAYMLDKIPVLPPIYRPISTHNGLTMVADSNYLYAQLLDARNDMEEAKGLPKELQQTARENLYNKWKELTGLYAPQDVKLQSKHVQGLLKWALGDSPKFSALQRKVLSATVDTVGRGAIMPDSRLRLNELGIPAEMAFNIFAPMVERSLVKRGYTPVQAMKMVKEHNDQARDVLNEVMKDHPVLMNRAPTLHKLSIMAFNPRLVDGHAIHVNPSIVVPFGADFDGNCCDYDSKIFLKILKSSHNIDSMCYVNSGIEPLNTKETLLMKIPFETRVTAHDLEDHDYVCMKIGEFPRIGNPVKDRNGADCYKVPEGFEVLSCDPKTGEACWQPVKMLTVENDCESVKVKLGSRELIVSTNESLAAFDPETGELTKVAPDKVGKRMIPVFKQSPAPFGTYGTRDLGWMLGAYISDGWTSGKTVGYAKLEQAKRDEFVRIVRSFHENFTVCTYEENTNGHSDSYKLGNSAKVHLNSQSLVEWFQQFDCIHEDIKDNADGKRTALYKRIPRYLIDYGNEEFLWGLFCGLLDGDGGVTKNMSTGKARFGCRFCTSSPYLRDDIAELCYRLGIRYCVNVQPPRGFSNEAYNIMPSTIDVYNNIDKMHFVGERERSLLAEWKENPPAEDVKDQVPVSESEWECLKPYINNNTDTSFYSGIMRTKVFGRRIARFMLMRHLDIIKEQTPELYARVMNTNTIWMTVDSVEPAGTRQVFDFEVEGTKVFAINNGVVIWDTVNIHAPVSDKARRQAYDKMFPERNLISMRSRGIVYKPEKEYQQGLYIGTRMKQGADVRTRYFNTLEEAKQAYRQGLIDIDDPIEIRNK